LFIITTKAPGNNYGGDYWLSYCLFSIYVPPTHSTPNDDRDYVGASNIGIKALLVRRPGAEGDGEHKEPGEDLSGVSVVHSLSEVVEEVLKSRSDAQNFQASA